MWKMIECNDIRSSHAIVVPGGMVIRSVERGPCESSDPAVALVFVPCTETQATKWIDNHERS